MEKGKIDVMVSTYNSEKFLDACLSSIVKNIPVKTLWVIDKFSKDDTKAIALKYGAKVVQSDCSLAESRALGFRLVETPIFVNIDSDVVLCDNWFAKVMKYWRSDVGALCGIAIDQHPLQKAYTEAMFKLKSPINYKVFRLPNMIARKDLLENIQFSKAVKSGSVANENFAIGDWIIKKGYQCVVAPIFSKHYSSPPLIDLKTYWYGASARITGTLSFTSILYRTMLCGVQAVVTAVLSNNARLVPYWIKFRLQIISGYLNWKKYFDLQR